MADDFFIPNPPLCGMKEFLKQSLEVWGHLNWTLFLLSEALGFRSINACSFMSTSKIQGGCEPPSKPPPPPALFGASGLPTPPGFASALHWRIEGGQGGLGPPPPPPKIG